MSSLLIDQGSKMLSTGNSPRAGKWVFIMTVVVTFILVMPNTAHALLLDPARNGLEADLTAANFENPQVVGLFFGLLEFVLIAIPIGTGSMALANMNRGTEAWMPWITTMGGALVFIAFITVIINTVYGGGAGA